MNIFALMVRGGSVLDGTDGSKEMEVMAAACFVALTM
jgi:hypothetical protein